MSAFAEGTKRNRKTQWKSYLLFCTYFDLHPLPCDIDTICLYAQFLSRSFKSVESIMNYVCGVKVLHLILELPFEHLDSFYFKLFVRGLKRCNPHTIKAALPITPDILIKIKNKLEFSCDNHVTYWCLFLFSFFLMCRKSNLVGTSQDQSKCLKREDVSLKENCLTVKFRWTKTIQFGERCLEIPIYRKSSSSLCPYKAYQEMISRFPSNESGAAFIVRCNNKTKPVSYSMLQAFIKKIIHSIGIDPSGYSTHSFRRGGATWAFKSGVKTELIQLQGDWRSDAYKLYLKYDLQDKLAVSKCMFNNIHV